MCIKYPEWNVLRPFLTRLGLKGLSEPSLGLYADYLEQRDRWYMLAERYGVQISSKGRKRISVSSGRVWDSVQVEPFDGLEPSLAI